MKERLLTLLLAVFMLSFAACGSDDGGGDDNDDDGDPQPTWEGEEILYGGDGNTRRWVFVTDDFDYDDNFREGAYLEFRDEVDTTNIVNAEGPERKLCKGFIADTEIRSWSLEENAVFDDPRTAEVEEINFDYLFRTFEDYDGGPQEPEFLIRRYKINKLKQDSLVIQNIQNQDVNIQGYLLVPATE